MVVVVVVVASAAAAAICTRVQKREGECRNARMGAGWLDY